MESGKRFNNPEAKKNEPFRQAEKDITDRNERNVAKRLADAAWRSLGYDPQSGDTVPASFAPTTAEHIGGPSEDQPKKASSETVVSISDVYDEDELFESRDSIDIEAAEPSQAEIAMQKFMRQELLACGNEYHKLIHEESELEVAYMAKNNYDSNRMLDAKLKENQRAKQDLAQKSPEGYYIVYGNELRSHINEIRNGNMVTTPYVKENLEHLERNMAIGQPTFIHGHLGGGKTELAITAAKQSAISRAAYEDASQQFLQYKAENPGLKKKDYRDFLASTYRKNITHFEKALRDGDSETKRLFIPLIVSGSKDLTTQDLFADKTLKLTKFNGKTILEHKKDLDAEFDKWKAENPEDAKDPQKSQDAANKILEIFKLKNQAFGTEVETVKQAVYRGVEEGRPVIIDEANAIPTAILISLNDVLQRRPGDNCYIPGVGATKIKPGFSITMTGNLTSNIVDYRGTERLNPAFESRLDILEYDYLPMSENDRSYKEQLHPEDNELFQVIVMRLADRQGNLRLPEIDKSLEKIFNLCQLAHETQRIFSGKWRESDFNHKTASGDEIEPRLEDSVLSIRNVMRVIDKWEKGRKGGLDKALWDGFIQGITNPDDQNFILGIAKHYGFFQDSDGWNVQMKERGASRTDFSEIHPGKYEYQPKDFEVYSYRKVVEALYGPAPERELYPDINLDELASIGDDEVGIEDIVEYEARMEELSKAILALEVLGGQCGCNVNNDNNLND
ncbi:hypothetical protein IIY68_04115 [Candidatus Saccharibacteria bacterium]|nr:hypothetical protein [Candidatus Saccharibacteria bacterium]